MSRLLFAVAVAAEAEAVLAGVGEHANVTIVGVGPAAAAATTARQLALAEAAGIPYDTVISAGIGGGFDGRVDIGEVAVATVCVAADLGAESPEGFLPLDELGFGTTRLGCTVSLPIDGAAIGEILTVSTVTGTAEGTTALRNRFPAAVAEGMEGFGVATAALAAGVGFAELRAISNLVGPRERAKWRIGAALARLRAACVEALEAR